MSIDVGQFNRAPRLGSSPPAGVATHPAITAAVAEYEKWFAEHERAWRDLEAAQEGYQDALQRDVRASAEAISAGGKDPGGKHAAACEKAAHEAARRVRGTRTLIEDALERVQATGLEHRAGELARIEQAIDAGMGQVRGLADELESVLAGISEQRSLRRWLSRFGQGDRLELVYFENSADDGHAAVAALRSLGDPRPAPHKPVSTPAQRAKVPVTSDGAFLPGAA